MFDFTIKKQLLRHEEVCTILGCGRNLVYTLLEEGKIIAHNATPDNPKRTRILSQSVVNYLNTGILPPDIWCK